MTRAVLERLETGDQGTFGRIHARGLTLFTGELPWRGNQPNVSCIPAGLYQCLWTYSPAFRKPMYLVVPVGGRAGIRIHSANLMGAVALGFRAQLNGCIALGERMGWIDGQKAVLVSAPAVRRFESEMGHAPFELEIRDGMAQ